MIKRQITKQGNSLGVTLPPEMLAQFGLRQGSSVRLEVDREHGGILVMPVAAVPEEITPAFGARVDAFLERYRPAMDALAKR